MIFNIIILILLCINLGISIYLFKNRKKKTEDKKKIDVELSKFILEEGFFDKINNYIDTLIKNQAEIYQIMILSSNESVTQYLNAEEQDKMQAYLSFIVNDNISDEVKELIRLAYNIKDDKKIKDIINMRIKLYLINFVVEYNKDIEK